jgi:endonuclease/exonuclease/phosphatase family metal-dependent hydrolase
MFIHGRISVTAILAFFLVFPAWSMAKKPSQKLPEEISEPEPKPHGSMNLRVLSYNIQGLPPPIGDDLRRIEQIGRLMSVHRKNGQAPHIVALQEGFPDRQLNALIRASGYPYYVKGPETGRGKVVNSGLYVLSEFPLSSYSEVVFDHCTGTDCYATKGVMRVRVHVPGVPEPIYLFNTHMNADMDPLIPISTTVTVRIQQLRQAHTWRALMNLKVGPQFFIGDFNFHPGYRDYEFLRQTSDFRYVHEECIKRGCSSNGTDIADDLTKSYDHQFYQPGSRISVVPTHLERNYSERFLGRPLSDHLGLEVHYRLEW